MVDRAAAQFAYSLDLEPCRSAALALSAFFATFVCISLGPMLQSLQLVAKEETPSSAFPT